MRFILGIDTASPWGSVALAADGRVISVEPLAPGEHSSRLSVKAAGLLLAQGIGFGDLAGIAVSRGPGSFTGLRIGLAWSKGIALARGVPLVLVSAHEAMAGAHRDRSDLLATVIPAERGHVEWTLWHTGREQAPMGRPERAELVDLPEILERGRAEAPVAVVPATPQLAEEIASLDWDEQAPFTFLGPVPLAPAVAEIGNRLLQAGEREDPVTASPRYGRAPNARKPAQP